MDYIIEAVNLTKFFETGQNLRDVFFRKARSYLKAVDGISFGIEEGDIFGVVGESGCGKTTALRVLLRLIDKTSGQIIFKGREISELKGKKLKELRKEMQIVFQNPFASIESNTRIRDLLLRPLRYHHIAGNQEEEMRRIEDVLTSVDLCPAGEFMSRFPYELSGGQLQRVSIARSLIIEPNFLAMDEPVSMLDVSIRAGILKMLINLKKVLDLTYLFVTHDISLAKFLCNRIAVMYLGKIVEMGPARDVLMEPLHPYTKALKAITPSLRDAKRYRKLDAVICGEVPNPIDLSPGCRFRPRCLYSEGICSEMEPVLVPFGEHYVACHLLS